MNKVKRLEPEYHSAPPAGTLSQMQTPIHVRSVEAIAARILNTQRALGLNQRQLCAIAGIATNTYNQWVKAKGRPDLDEAFKLCDAFGLTLDWIYFGDPSGLPHALAIKLVGPPQNNPPAPAPRTGTAG